MMGETLDKTQGFLFDSFLKFKALCGKKKKKTLIFIGLFAIFGSVSKKVILVISGFIFTCIWE
jgi:hypothetical protein